MAAGAGGGPFPGAGAITSCDEGHDPLLGDDGDDALRGGEGTTTSPATAITRLSRGPGASSAAISGRPHNVGLFSETGTTVLEDTAWHCDIDHDRHLHEQKQNLTLKDGRVIGPRGWVRR